MEQFLARALSGAASADVHSTDERILDGALEEIAARGTASATMDGIARRAGVGRMTVFRRFGTKEALIERLGLRELGRFLALVDSAVASLDDPADRVVETFVVCVRVGAAHPFVARQVREEPWLAFERLSRGTPSPMDVSRAYVAASLRRLAAAGHPVVEDADLAADVLVRLVASYVLQPGGPLDLGDEDAIRAFARRVLAPIATR